MEHVKKLSFSASEMLVLNALMRAKSQILLSSLPTGQLLIYLSHNESTLVGICDWNCCKSNFVSMPLLKMKRKKSNLFMFWSINNNSCSCFLKKNFSFWDQTWDQQPFTLPNKIMKSEMIYCSVHSVILWNTPLSTVLY